MNGAESLVRTLVNAGVEVCFTNPGTSEMHFVALGLSKRTDREGKQRRDAMMAEAVARLVLEHLPQFPMVEGDLEGFEAPVRRELEAIA